MTRLMTRLNFLNSPLTPANHQIQETNNYLFLSYYQEVRKDKNNKKNKMLIELLIALIMGVCAGIFTGFHISDPRIKFKNHNFANIIPHEFHT